MLHYKSPERAFYEENAVLFMKIMDSGEWRVTRMLADHAMTDECNQQHLWMVERQIAPYGSDKSIRHWFGATPLDALFSACDDLKIDVTKYIESCRSCNDHGMIGGHLQDGSGYGEPCPECNSL